MNEPEPEPWYPIDFSLPPCEGCGARWRYINPGRRRIQHVRLYDGKPCPVSEAERRRTGNGHETLGGR
jgi:hypothetical protein